jgi:hypothetical protein
LVICGSITVPVSVQSAPENASPVLAEGKGVPEDRRGERNPSTHADSVVVPVTYKPPALRGRPLPWKRSFPIIQGGFLWSLTHPDPYGEAEVLAVVDLGAMRNLSPRAAVGGTFSLSGSEDYLRIGFKPRLRRWLTRTTSADFALGPFYALTTRLATRITLESGSWGRRR